MDATLERLAIDICARALELPREARATFVNGQCLENAALEDRVFKLLSVATEQPNPVSTGGWVSSREHDLTGQQLDDYVLEDILGSGGMGTVYRAVRKREGVTARFALKTINRMVGSAADLARFNAEQSTLARLNHPYISSFVDMGTSEGTPYFVMEYVDGRPINEHCDQYNLAIPERIKLWMKVCDAVLVAHSRLIVHRDIKPGNVLVTADHIPKLVDFGVARSLEEKSDLTTEFGVQYTINYASPERILHGETGTMCDQYALAVLLYELIVGVLPFDRQGLQLAALTDTVQHPAPRLLHRFDTLPAQERQDAAARRATPYRQLRGVLKSDLCELLRKALHPDPAQRYRSINDMLADVRAFMADQPVAAKPDTLSYRATKFGKRHAALVGVATVSGLLVVGAALYSAAQFIETQKHLHRAQVTAQFLADIVAAPSTRWSSQLKAGPDATMPEILQLASTELQQNQSISPELRAELHIALKTAFFSWNNTTAGIQEMKRALHIVDSELPPAHPLQESVRTNTAIAMDMHGNPEDLEDAANLLTEALAWLDRFAPDDPIRRGIVVGELAHNHQIQGDCVKAVELYEQALALLEGGGDSDTPLIALGYSLKGICLFRLAAWDAAYASLQKSVAISNRLPGRVSVDMETAYRHLLELTLWRGSATEPRELALSLVEIFKRDQIPAGIARDLLNVVAYVFTRSGDFDQAHAVLDALDGYEVYPDEADEGHATQLVRAALMAAQDRPEPARALVTGAELSMDSVGNGWAWIYANTMADIELRRGNPEQAESYLVQASDQSRILCEESLMAIYWQSLVNRLSQASQPREPNAFQVATCDDVSA